MHAFFHQHAPSAPELQSVVLGMDGGGTKTEILIANLQGEIIASHIGGPTNLAAIPEVEAMDNLEEALGRVFRGLKRVRVVSAVVGVAGVDAPSDEARFHTLADALMASFGISEYQLLNDSAVALANGTTAANAIILIAGTGSICYGHNEQGKTARAGGMDYLLADEGSGYWIGRKVLRAVVRAHDGREQVTVLTELVLQHFGITQVSELKQKVYQPLLSKMGIAELAKVWEAALKEDDAVARHIQTRIVAKLVQLVEAVARSLEFTAQPFDLVLAGSIARLSVVEPQLRARLQELFPAMTVKLPTTSPAHGAITLALQGVSPEPELSTTP